MGTKHSAIGCHHPLTFPIFPIPFITGITLVSNREKNRTIRISYPIRLEILWRNSNGGNKAFLKFGEEEKLGLIEGEGIARLGNRFPWTV